jgi:hypothetical protein
LGTRRGRRFQFKRASGLANGNAGRVCVRAEVELLAM